MPAEQLEQLFKVIEGGAEVAADNIVKFPVDAAGSAAETALAGEGITTAVEMGNGVAAEVSQLTVIEGGASAATTTGLGILGMELTGVVGAVAGALGIVAGVAGGFLLYNLAPDFWTNIADKLTEAGQTVGGKVRAFLNGNTKQAGVSETTIEIIKQALIDAGLFDLNISTPKEEMSSIVYVTIEGSNYQVNVNNYNKLINNSMFFNYGPSKVVYSSGKEKGYVTRIGDTSVLNCYNFAASENFYNKYGLMSLFEVPENTILQGSFYYFDIISGTEKFYGAGKLPTYKVVINNVTRWFSLIKNANWSSITDQDTYYYNFNTLEPGIYPLTNSGITPYVLAVIFAYIFGCSISNVNVQEGATLPSEEPFPQTYPEWKPWAPPEAVPWPENLPNIYPIEFPLDEPVPEQAPAQDPAPLNDPVQNPDSVLDWLLDILPVPDPVINPQPQPVPEPDPDPQPEPEPLPDPGDDPIDPGDDPIDPNPDPIPSLPIVPILPETVSATRMFTVYNPTESQLNQFGAWLWTSDIVSQLIKIWSGDPINGILSLRKVYCTPVTGSTINIIVGYLDSGVDAAKVVNQFVTIDCGTADVAEVMHNSTDYPPYTSLHLYLPFIGVIELDPNEFVNGKIKVRYHIDVYTGTCLAEVLSIRTKDMPEGNILYTFSGNASQEIPLTAANWSGAISSLVSLGAAAIGVASGGALGAVAGASLVGHSISHEMIHMNRSGSLSANAGIMGSRYPYIIIGRRNRYDANGYNELYGYPANKTVYLNNCSGFVRVKAGRLRSKATENEKTEIMDLLKKGVIL